MKELNLKLNIEDANLILKGLGNLPYVQVHELIGKIHQQASSQATAAEEEEPEELVENAVPMVNM